MFDYTGGGIFIFTGETPTVSPVYNYESSGSFVFSGESTTVSPVYNYESSGIFVFSENSDCKLFLNFEPSGNLISFETNPYYPTLFNRSYFINNNFNWNVQNSVAVDFQSAWDIGEQKTYYYQIEGKCIQPSCENTGFDPSEVCLKSGKYFIQIIAAKNLKDLCSKFKLQTMNNPTHWPISSIKKYSRPVYIDEITDEDNCTTLELVDFNQVPECLELSLLDDELTINFGVDVSVQYTFKQVAVGGLFYFGGQSDCSYIVSTIMTGGIFNFNGTSPSTSNYYQHVAVGNLDFSGESEFVSTTWNYISEGGFSFSGNSSVKSTMFDYTANGGFTFSGYSQANVVLNFESPQPLLYLSGNSNLNINLNFDLNPDNLFLFSGNSIYTSNYYQHVPEGQLSFFGESEVTSPVWNYIPSGGFNFNGSIIVERTQVSNGGFSFEGDSEFNVILNHSSLGGFEFNGESRFTSPIWNFITDGVFEFNGESLDLFDNLGEHEFDVVTETSEELIEYVEPTIVNLPAINPDIELITNSCCGPLPLNLYLNHNFNYFNIFKYFLNRNGVVLNPIINLKYSDFDKTWRYQWQFMDSIESWNFIIEWSCTDQIGSVNFDVKFWKLSILLRRTLNSIKQETRILYIIPSNFACTENQDLDFRIKLNPNSGAITFPEDLEINDFILNDSIGVFGDSYWDSHELEINISSFSAIESLNKIDIKPLFPVGSR